MKKLQLAGVLTLAWLPWFLGALQTWDSGTFEASPANSDAVSQGDDKIRELKENVRERGEVEHLWGTISSGGDNGRHREGSARIFYDSTDPTALSNSVTDTAASGALDEGRLYFESDTGQLQVYNGSAWVEALTATGGNASNRFDILSGMQFLKAGADAMDIHAHDARHRLGGSDGAWTDAADGMPFAIQQILSDTSLDTSACATLNNAALSSPSQTFGEAGDACFSISTGLNFTGRTGNSRVLAIAVANVSPEVSQFCTAQMAIFVDSLASQMGVTAAESVQGDADGRSNLVVVGYSTTFAASAHEIAVHLSDVTNLDCDITNGSLYVIDLGNSS